MTPHFADDRVTLYGGDSLEVLPTLPAESVDCVVTDPPAGISFMGRDWDHHKGGRAQWAAWLAEVMREAYRVAKPGAHALVWALPRTSHWTAIGIEDAGWEIRDRVTHLFGTGFPKSRDVSKAIDSEAGVVRTEVIGVKPGHENWAGYDGYKSVKGDGALSGAGGFERPWMSDPEAAERYRMQTAPATEAARRWQGWHTALKPAAEDWWLARKPLVGTVAGNVLRYGTGALNIDATRIGTSKNVPASPRGQQDRIYGRYGAQTGEESGHDPNVGRWPANVALDEHAAQELDQQSGEQRDGVAVRRNGVEAADGWGNFGTLQPGAADAGYGSGGGASRFFYTAKASSEERITHNGVAHPTVKPLSLMRWLVRLVTPPISSDGKPGLILDPFAGSGTTVEAAILEGFRCIAIERGGPPGTDEHEYLPMIVQRINRRRNPIAYIKAAGEDLGLFELDEGA